MSTAASHWSSVYTTRAVDQVSWYEEEPTVSLRLIVAAATPQAAVVDVGAGASTLVDALLRDGYRDLTLLDVAKPPLDHVRSRLGELAALPSYMTADVTRWRPQRQYDVWHDRALFHFLTDRTRQAAYLATATTAVRATGALVVGTFAGDGPATCSGLPTARYDVEQLAAVFRGGFDLEHAERAQHHTPSGDVQPFTWAVLRRKNTAGAGEAC